MIVTALILNNEAEMIDAAKQAEILSLQNKTMPEPEFVDKEFLFPLAACAWAFRLDNGCIKTIVAGTPMLLKSDEEVWERLKEHFKNI